MNIICKIFGHKWIDTGIGKNENYKIVSAYGKCKRCNKQGARKIK